MNNFPDPTQELIRGYETERKTESTDTITVFTKGIGLKKRNNEKGFRIEKPNSLTEMMELARRLFGDPSLKHLTDHNHLIITSIAIVEEGFVYFVE